MRRTLLALNVLFIASAVGADDFLRLSGWAAIPSEYRHPGPISGQFAGPANGVTPPYSGQPIPGFSGMIPAETPGEYIALPDNGFGAQSDSADFVIGFYTVRPVFKTSGDGTTEPGPVDVLTLRRSAIRTVCSTPRTSRTDLSLSVPTTTRRRCLRFLSIRRSQRAIY